MLKNRHREEAVYIYSIKERAVWCVCVHLVATFIPLMNSHHDNSVSLRRGRVTAAVPPDEKQKSLSFVCVRAAVKLTWLAFRSRGARAQVKPPAAAAAASNSVSGKRNQDSRFLIDRAARGARWTSLYRQKRSRFTRRRSEATTRECLYALGIDYTSLALGGAKCAPLTNVCGAPAAASRV